MKVGLFFGSFNPIHTGHLIIANTVINETEISKIWFIVSPQRRDDAKDAKIKLRVSLRLRAFAVNLLQIYAKVHVVSP